MYTASHALLDALTQAGVSYIFGNFGSDHPALLEAISEADAHGRPVPKIVTAPYEMVGLAAAGGYAQVSGRPQAVVVHVECGTQSLAGAVHNVSRARIPVLIFAGLSPFTQHGEAKGSRNEFIQWIQDVSDQRGIVRGYMKYDNELRSPANVEQIVWRSLQLATSDPKGPVYLTGAREVMEARAKPHKGSPAAWRPLEPAALSEDGLQALVRDLRGARRPLVVTSYMGRNPAAVPELVRLCERLGAGVLESAPSYMNFPHDNPLYQGCQWNEPHQNEALAEADVVLVLDSDVPWIPTISRPNRRAKVHHIDVDPLKQGMPLWGVETVRSFQADAFTALRQLNAALDRGPRAVKPSRGLADYEARHRRRRAALAEAAATPEGRITTEFLVAAVRRHVDEQTICLNEGITNYTAVWEHLSPTRPGGAFTSGAGSLGWSGGAALGVKLARPEATVIAISGDGCFMFSVPSSVFWMARRYDAPYLHIVLNNGGWRAPRFSALAIHPDGYASRSPDLPISFETPPDYSGIAAAAGGAWARKIARPEEVEPALIEALRAVRVERRAAVLDVEVVAK